MNIRAFITHKPAETFENCQDRFGVNSDTKSIALSDGMSQSWHQKIWAQLLVDTFVDSSDWFPDTTTIKPLCLKWRENVVDFISKLKDCSTEGLSQREIKELTALIYRNERHLARGYSAGATFVGIRFEGYAWRGSVLGDSCLIEWNGKEATFYTSQNEEKFDSFPDYFDSDASKEGKGTPKEINGVLPSDGQLFLVSDPFSDFLLKHKQRGDIKEYIEQLLALSSHEEFEKLVDSWRHQGMHEDDTTVVIVEYNDSIKFNNQVIDDIFALVNEEKALKETFQENGTEESDSQEKSLIKDEREPSNSFILLPNDIELFIKDCLNEIHRCLQKRLPKRKEKFKFKWILSAIEEALRTLSERYSIRKK